MDNIIKRYFAYRRLGLPPNVSWAGACAIIRFKQ